MLCSWGEQLDAPFVVIRTPDSLRAWTDSTQSATWRRGLNIGATPFADAVPDRPGEELLIAEPQFELLRIRNARDFSFWGQTSSFGTGYDEIKVVSRYDQEYRRLVVRYGSELRIYRFGEPIYTDAEDARPELPNELTLMAYPNPFNPTTMIAFDLPKARHATLAVYDLNGRVVKTLVNEQMSAGHHELGFDGASLPSGIYFARLNAGELVRTQKLVLLK
ncbi:MAG: T9SS type A sorting domain-containing protein [bacterium]|nr:T9SS type A sorting domain-containing protein [bacterium]